MEGAIRSIDTRTPVYRWFGAVELGRDAEEVFEGAYLRVRYGAYFRNSVRMKREKKIFSVSHDRSCITIKILLFAA